MSIMRKPIPDRPPPGSPALVPLALEGPSDATFIDDLVAANRFKVFLVGRGIEVPSDVLLGLGRLTSEFQDDLSRLSEHDYQSMQHSSKTFTADK